MAPGDAIKYKLEERGWTQADFARIIGRPLPVINKIINGKTSITPDTARELAEAFGTEPNYWLSLDSAYRLSIAKKPDKSIRKRASLYEIAPVKEMEKRGWIGRVDSIATLEKELHKFFGVKSLAKMPAIPFAARSSAEKKLDISASQNAWCFRAAKLAKSVQASKFSKRKFEKACSEFKKLAAYPENIRMVPRMLSDMGIRLVVLEHLPKTKIDGAVLWLNETSPVITLSMRYDRIDYFWHTLAHELSHIRHRDAFSLDMDFGMPTLTVNNNEEDIEKRADQEATEFLISRQDLESFMLRIKPFYSKKRIVQFANRIQIHPGIIAGQLQHKGEIKYTANKEMLVKIRDILTDEALTDGWGKTVNIN